MWSTPVSSTRIIALGDIIATYVDFIIEKVGLRPVLSHVLQSEKHTCTETFQFSFSMPTAQGPLVTCRA